MKNLCVCLMSIFLFNVGFAQSDITIKGKVLSAKDGQALPFAYVQLKEASIGTVTNAQGDYFIKIPMKLSGNVLEFSYLGYEKYAIKVADISPKSQFVVKLKESSTVLQEVVIVPKKEMSAKQLLKQVLKNIDENYADKPFNAEAYYRESIRESGTYIKYADAACNLHLGAYAGEVLKKKNFGKNKTLNMGIGSVAYSWYWGDRLHRGHFNSATLPSDQVEVIATRISESLTKHRMEANIEAGPIGMIGKDRIKYLRYFMDTKNYNKYIFQVGEVQGEDGKWQYVLSFKPKATVNDIKSIENRYKGKKAWKASIGIRKLFDRAIAGKVYINQVDFAVTRIEYSVPNDFKEHICGFKTMAIKHFDYKIQLDYQKIGERWYPSKLVQDDEFIFVDTLKQTTTPYLARQELFIGKINTSEVAEIPADRRFENHNLNTLYEDALEYHPDFWKAYTEKYAVSQVPDFIVKDMSAEKPLEKQFQDVFVRDEDMPAPIAKKQPVETKLHGVTLVDDYAWLKDPKKAIANNEIMGYIDAENDYAANYARPLRKNQRQLFNEMMLIEKPNKTSLPSYSRGYYYATRFTVGQDYPVYFRIADADGAKEEILFDVNEMAKEHDGYYSLAGFAVAPDNQLVAFGENTDGSDNSIVKFKNLNTGELLKDSLEKIVSLAWFADGTGFYYSKQEPKTNRTSKIFYHILGTPQSEDKLIYEENDPRFDAGVGTTNDFKYVMISSNSKTASEVHIKENRLDATFKVISPRRENHAYGISYQTGKLYIMTDRKHKNMELMVADISQPEEKYWKPFVPANPNAVMTGFKVFKKYVAISETGNAQSSVKILNLETGEIERVKLKKDEYGNVSIGNNPKADTDTIRLSFGSLKSLNTTYDYNMSTGKSKIAWVDSLRVKFRHNWSVERIWATAKDGTKVPVTLFYNKVLRKKRFDHDMLWLTSYGAYGASSLANFSNTYLPLIRRGFVVAIAHVRGGMEMGKDWYEDGKMRNKMNTFTDFIACAEALISEGYTQKGKIVAQGGSAGGLLMGAIANMRPDLFHTIVLDVPFVDVVNTMLDDKLPLTTGEYEEWGNPNQKKDFKYMLKYSPYENVKSQDYPNMLFFTAMNDQRVGYWEPAKMVAKLRQHNTSDNLILLKTDLNAGHGGGARRFSYYKALAYKYSIIFDLIGKEVEENAEASK